MVKVNLWVMIGIIAAIVVALIVFGSNVLSPKSRQTVGNFLVDDKSAVCTELNRTIVYMFGSKSCPHCQWEDPIIKSVASSFGSLISFHENIDSQNDMDIFSKYDSSGYVPLVVIGCKYYRVGSGENLGQDQETKVLTALICSLTNGQPSSACSQVESLTSQVG